MPFIKYLIENENYEDVQFLLKNISKHSIQSSSLSDSLNFYQGWAYYGSKVLDTSTVFFLKVKETSSFYQKSRFFSAYNQIFLHNYNESESILSKLNSDDSLLIELKHFQLSGVALMKRDLEKFKELSSSYTQNYFAYSNEELNFLEISKELTNHKQKSPVLAGIISGIIPGSGKIYAGKTGEGVAAFLSVVTLAAMAFENFRKDGIRDYKTLLFAGFFGVFYIGNIYGSVYYVKKQKDNFYESIDHQLLFDLHIPLRTVFN